MCSIRKVISYNANQMNVARAIKKLTYENDVEGGI